MSSQSLVEVRSGINLNIQTHSYMYFKTCDSITLLFRIVHSKIFKIQAGDMAQCSHEKLKFSSQHPYGGSN